MLDDLESPQIPIVMSHVIIRAFYHSFFNSVTQAMQNADRSCRKEAGKQEHRASQLPTPSNKQASRRNYYKFRETTMTIEIDKVSPVAGPALLTNSEEEHALNSFSNFLQYETVSATGPSTGAYKEAANYLISELSSIPCLDKIHLLHEAPDHSPVVVARWKGSDDDLPVVLLNSHYDVVPASKEDWTVEPFEGLRKDGRIYGRGAQDMKCV